MEPSWIFTATLRRNYGRGWDLATNAVGDLSIEMLKEGL